MNDPHINGSDFNKDFIIAPTFEELPEEEKREVEALRAEYEKALLDRYQKTRHGVIKDNGSPPTFTKPEASTPPPPPSFSDEQVFTTMEEHIYGTNKDVFKSFIRVMFESLEAEKKNKQPVHNTSSFADKTEQTD